MKISIIKSILCIRSVVKLIDGYVESKKSDSQDGKKVSQEERRKNKENAYIVLENIISILTK